MVILIPARRGSERLPGKALLPLGGKPLLAWTIASALQVLQEGAYRPTVVVASEDPEILREARHQGADTWSRPLHTASSDAPDIAWLRLALAKWPLELEFMIRRPTSPFVSVDTMVRAWVDFQNDPSCTAMRAVRPAREHPMKMWMRTGPWITRAVWNQETAGIFGVENHSTPTQLLPRTYVQTAGLELVRRSTLEAGSLTGPRLAPIFLEGAEAIDINTPADWAEAQKVADER